MPLPLIAAAITIGAGRALYGASRARAQAKLANNAINRAYGVAATDQAMQQSDTRQSSNEDLNRRGVLASGAVGGPVSPIGMALNDKTDHPGHLNRTNEAGYYTAAGANSLGTSNTLSGGLNRTQTDAFYRQRSALNEEKGQSLDAVKQQKQQGYLDAITGGINMGLSAYSLGSGNMTPSVPSLGGAPSATQNSAPPPTPGLGPMPNVATGSFGLPVNPVLSPQPGSGTIVAGSQPNSTFNVGRGPQP